MALWDLAGKAYNVPVYQMLGGKFRDRIRCYADTTESHDPKVYGQRLKARRDEGFTWLKMDLGVDLVADVPGALTMPVGQRVNSQARTQHMFTGMEITEKGVQLMADYVARSANGGHGHSAFGGPLRTHRRQQLHPLGKALTKYNLAWLEDMVPVAAHRPVEADRRRGGHPDPHGRGHLPEGAASSSCAGRTRWTSSIPTWRLPGGILETKKIGDAAQELGVPMAMHFAGTPVSCMANVHCAAATENFLVLENHSVDVPWWSDLVDGVEKPIVNKGFITVPDKPGLGSR
jgi:L-alanine-DL-glutamate epimerase-like enolase superfamily enzyme